MSNLAFRSSVMPGTVATLMSDVRLRHRVRGAGAIRKLARAIRQQPLFPHFSPRQISELAQEQPCAQCGARPEGPVMVDGLVVLAIRCPSGSCAAPSRVFELALDERACQLLLARASAGDFGAAIDRLLQSGVDLDAMRDMEGPVVFRRPVRLSPSTDFVVRGLGVTQLSALVAGLLDRHSS